MKTISFFITTRCNFACKTCFGGFKRGDDISIDLFKQTLDEFTGLGYDAVSLTGGEPCLHPYFAKIVELIAAKKMVFMFTSNGFFPEKYDFILHKYKKQLKQVNFSLDGATQGVHDYIRHVGSFEKATKAVCRYASLGIDTGISMCVNKTNMHQIEDVMALAEQLGANRLEFVGIINNKYNSKLLLDDKDRKECYLRIAAITKKSKLRVLVHSSLRTHGGVYFCDNLKRYATLSVSPQAKVIFCSCIRHSREIGSLQGGSFQKIYKRYQKLAFFLHKIRSNMIDNHKITNGFNSCEFCNFFFQ